MSELSIVENVTYTQRAGVFKSQSSRRDVKIYPSSVPINVNPCTSLPIPLLNNYFL